VTVERFCPPDHVPKTSELSVAGLLRLVGTTRHHGFPVLNGEGALVGVVSWKDAQQVPYAERERLTVADIMSREAITVTPRDPARRALDLIERHGIGRVIVVDPDGHDRVHGVVTKQDLIKAYAGWVPAD
jgi:CBS domain-containing protein